MYLVCKKLGYSLFQDDKTNKKIFEVIKKNIPNTFFLRPKQCYWTEQSPWFAVL